LKLGGLVNNAGIIERISFAESGDDVWERQFNANLYSAVGLTRGLYSELKLNKGSSVLKVSSTLGLRPIANTVAYSASKAAMVNWTQGLAIEWAADQIRVNCLCPGLVDTPIHAARPPDDVQPLGRLGQPDDVAKAAWFLLSPDSSWTTGAVLRVDGGISL
jgi:NAD(P)-dependent dehydrogenase (short-subunit alcohol dehydrogenase family)